MPVRILCLLPLFVLGVAANAAEPVKKDNPMTEDRLNQICAFYDVNVGTAPGVAFQPGVDVHGKPVVPADMDSSLHGEITPPDILEIPLTVDLAERLGITVPGLQMDAPIGLLKIHKDGHVDFNGQLVAGTGVSGKDIAAICKSR